MGQRGCASLHFVSYLHRKDLWQVPQLTEALRWYFHHIKQQNIDCKTGNTGNQLYCDFYILKWVQLLSLHWVPIIAYNVPRVCHALCKHGIMTKCTLYITWYFYSSCPMALSTTDICGCSHSLSLYLFAKALLLVILIKSS